MGTEFNIRTDATTHPNDVKSVPVYWAYKDWYHHQVSSTTLTGGKDAASLIVTIPTSQEPNFGGGKLKGYKLGMFVNHIDAGNAYTHPTYNVYQFERPVTKEGTFGAVDTVATTDGRDILCYTMRNDNSGFMFEGFEAVEFTDAKRTIAKSTEYWNLPWQLAWDNAAWNGYMHASKEDFKERYVNDDGNVEIVKERVRFSTEGWVLNIWESGREVYVPINRSGWDDPEWSVDWVISNAIASFDTTVVASERFNNRDTWFNMQRSGGVQDYETPTGGQAIVYQDELLKADDGNYSNVSVKMVTFRSATFARYQSDLMLGSKIPFGIPPPIPTSRVYGDTTEIASTGKLKQSLCTQITISFKINKMAPAFNILGSERNRILQSNGVPWIDDNDRKDPPEGMDMWTSGKDAYAGSYNTSLRGFFVVVADRPPVHEDYHGYITRLQTEGANFNSHAIQRVSPYSVTNPAAFTGEIGYFSYFVDDNTKMYKGGDWKLPPDIAAGAGWVGADMERKSDAFHETHLSNQYITSGNQIPLNEWLDMTLVLPTHSNESYMVLSDGKMVLASEKCGSSRDDAATLNEEWPLSCLTIWLTNTNSFSGIEAYVVGDSTVGNDDDMESEVIVDSVTIRGNFPNKQNCTVLDFNLQNRIDIGGELTLTDSKPMLYDWEDISEYHTYTTRLDEGTAQFVPFDMASYAFVNDDADGNVPINTRLPTYVSIGLNADIPDDRWLLFNHFAVISKENNRPIKVDNIKAFHSTATTELGNDISHDSIIGDGPLNTDADTGNFTFNGDKLLDYFTQKGFVEHHTDDVSGSEPLLQRECFAASTRIIGDKYGNIGSTYCTVENPELLRCRADESYIIYKINQAYSPLNYNTGSDGATWPLKIRDVNYDTGKVIFDQNIEYADYVFSDLDNTTTFNRNGTAQVLYFNVFRDAPSGGEGNNLNGYWFSIFNGDNERCIYYYSNNRDNTTHAPRDIGLYHHITRIVYANSDAATVMAAKTVTHINSTADTTKIDAVVPDGEWASVVATNRDKGECETREWGQDKYDIITTEGSLITGSNIPGVTLPDTIIDEDDIAGNTLGDFPAGTIIEIREVHTDIADRKNHKKLFRVKQLVVGGIALETPDKVNVWTGLGNPALYTDNINYGTAPANASPTYRRVNVRDIPERHHGNRITQYTTAVPIYIKSPLFLGNTCFISPWRKWFHFEIFNYDDNDIILPDKSYESILMGATPPSAHFHGPTWNEAIYTDAQGNQQGWNLTAEKNSEFIWDPSFPKPQSTAEDEKDDNYITKWKPQLVDFGDVGGVSGVTNTITSSDIWTVVPYDNYGRDVSFLDPDDGTINTTTINAVTTTGFDVVSKTGVAVSDAFQIGGYNLIDLSGIVEAKEKYEEGELASFFLTSSDMMSNLHRTSVDTFNDSATHSPFLLTTYYDEKPEISEFKVQPNQDDPFYPNYTWSSGDDDLWYGFLIQDYENIENQYKNTVLYIPLNDSTETSSGLISDNMYQKIKVNRKVSGIYSDTIPTDGQFSDSHEGLAGHCKKFGSNTFIRIDNTSGTFYDEPKAEMACIVHFTADDKPSGNEYIVNQDAQFSIYVDSTGYINATIRPHTTGVSGGSYGTTIELKSTSITSFQGQPTCVILVVDITAGTGNAKLYIDGKLEDQSGKKLPTPTKNNWGENYVLMNKGTLYIGASAISGTWPTKTTTNGFDGRIEEFVLYDRVIYPVVPQTGELTVFKAFEEFSTGTYASGRSVVARLFIKDYHNIRGKLSTQVASTSQVAFKKSGIGLDTYNI